MHFGNSNYLFPLFALGAALLALAVWTFFRDRRDLRELGHRNLVLSPVAALIRRGLKALLLLGALTACALGASRWLGQPIPGDAGQFGLDIMVVLDVSKSMLSRDVNPNRLEAAKQALLDSLGKLEGNRVGFEVFAGDAIIQVPLTLDMDAVSNVIEGADVDAVDLGGTNLAVALETALKAFPQDEKGQEPSKRGRVILFYTDGEPTAGENELKDALEEAKNLHVAVACIGVGTPKGQPIPDGQSFWGEAQYKHDEEGRMVVSRLDEDNLRAIASATGGLYVSGDSSGALSHIESLLNKLEKSMIHDKNTMQRHELAPETGLAASLLLLAAVAL
jgi:Ca-activated chloride channel family protein